MIYYILSYNYLFTSSSTFGIACFQLLKQDIYNLNLYLIIYLNVQKYYLLKKIYI